MEIQCFQVVWESQVLTPVSGSSSNTWTVIHQSTKMYIVVAVQLLNHVQLSTTPWTAAHQAFLYFTISQSLLRLMSIELVMPSNHLILCWPFSSCPQSFSASCTYLLVLNEFLETRLSLYLKFQIKSFYQKLYDTTKFLPLL